MEAYEGADWVRISDEVPVDEERRDAAAGDVPDPLPPRDGRRSRRPRSSRATRSMTRARTGRSPAARTRASDDGGRRMSDYTVVTREEAPDVMAPVPGLRRDAVRSPSALECDQVGVHLAARCRADTGGKGSYGHRHKHPGGGLLRDLGHGHSSRSATTCSRRAPDRGPRRAGRGALGPQRRPGRGRAGDLSRSRPTATATRSRRSRTSGRLDLSGARRGRAPDRTLPDQDGRLGRRSPTSAGRRWSSYFYPRADTPAARPRPAACATAPPTTRRSAHV